MKCRINKKNRLMTLVAAGLVLMAGGSLAAYLLPEAAHLATRIAGFFAGLGSALMLTGGALLLRRRVLGEKRTKESELMMTDERGLSVAYKAQNAAAIAAAFALIIISIVALVRGDSFYSFLCSGLLIAVALVKFVAWHVYNRIM